MPKIITRFIAAFKLPTNRFLGTLDHGLGLPKPCFVSDLEVCKVVGADNGAWPKSRWLQTTDR